MSGNVWNRLLGSSMVDTGILTINISSSPFWNMTICSDILQQRTLTRPDTWFCPIWDLHAFLCWDWSFWTWNIILDAPDIYKCSSFLLLYQYIYITTKLQLCYCCMVVTVLQSWIQYNKYGTLRSCIKVSLHVSVLKFCRGKGTIMKFWNWHITAATFKPQIRPIVDVGRVPPINIRVVVSSQNIIVAHFHD